MVCSVSASASASAVVTMAVNVFWSSRSELLAGTSGFQALDPSNAAAPLQPRDPSLGIGYCNLGPSWFQVWLSAEGILFRKKTPFAGWVTVRSLASC